MSFRRILLATLALVLIFVIGCDADKSEISSNNVAQTEIAVLHRAAFMSGVIGGGIHSHRVARNEEGVLALVGGKPTMLVGERSAFSGTVFNRSDEFRPEDPFDIAVEKGEFFTAGPIQLVSDYEFPEKRLRPRFSVGADVEVLCVEVGRAVLTLSTRGTTEQTSPVSTFATTVDFPIECVRDDEATRYAEISGDNEIPSIRVNDVHVPVSAVAATSGTGCGEMAWYPFTTPLLAIEDGKVLGGNDDIEPCGFGTLEDTEVVQVSLDEEEWGSYCGAVQSENPDLIPFLFPSCENVVANNDDSVKTPAGEITAIDSPTPVVLLDVQDPVQDLIPYTGVVFTIDGRPYETAQFRVEEGHDGCPLPHVHSDGPVHSYEQWFYRGGFDELQSTGDALLTDPDPNGCGHGWTTSLKNPPSVLVPIPVFVDFCNKVDVFIDTRFLPANCDAMHDLIE